MAIPNQITANHHVGTVHEDIAMGMRAEDFSHIQFMFDNLYSRPIEAVEREYATNAWDSHVFAGVTRPIEITLPTVENMEFVVQDYGLGMSIDTLREVYAFYGNSDKRQSNAVAGQLGVGSKSGLSYAAGFTVTAVKDHEKVSAFVTKDTHGNGVIRIIIAPHSTNEPNGVRIQIPVERHDIPTFHAYAKELFQFWAPGTVLIDGAEPEVPAWRANALPLDEWGHTLLVRTDQGLHSSYVIMGNVPYPVPDVTVGRTVSRFVATLNIGDVDFAPSREDVRHTQHTDQTLAELHDYIRGSFKRAIDVALTGVTSRWEEAMLKVLWMDRNSRIEAPSSERPIWWFNPHQQWGRKSKGHLRYALSSLSTPSLVVITGFSAKTVSTAARDRLTDFTTSKGIDKPTFIIFPEGAHTGVLDGRPRTFAWNEIIGATKVPKADKKARQARYETVYPTYSGPGMIGDDLAALSGKVLYIMQNEYVSHGTLGATVVVLRANQIDRVKRFVPGIEHYNVEVERRRKAAAAAVTDEDRKIRSARSLPRQYHNLDPDKVLDPDLARYIRLHKTPDTATLQDADNFGVEIKTGNLEAKFAKRYPLLHAAGHYYGSTFDTKELRPEVLAYVNMKHEASQAAQAVAS